MRLLPRYTLAAVALALGPLLVVAAVGACESSVSLDPMLVDGGPSDALDCPICADVSIEADYDAADVSIYGIQPEDGGAGAGDGG